MEEPTFESAAVSATPTLADLPTTVFAAPEEILPATLPSYINRQPIIKPLQQQPTGFVQTASFGFTPLQSATMPTTANIIRPNNYGHQMINIQPFSKNPFAQTSTNYNYDYNHMSFSGRLSPMQSQLPQTIPQIHLISTARQAHPNQFQHPQAYNGQMLNDYSPMSYSQNYFVNTPPIVAEPDDDPPLNTNSVLTHAASNTNFSRDSLLNLAEYVKRMSTKARSNLKSKQDILNEIQRLRNQLKSLEKHAGRSMIHSNVDDHDEPIYSEELINVEYSIPKSSATSKSSSSTTIPFKKYSLMSSLHPYPSAVQSIIKNQHKINNNLKIPKRHNDNFAIALSSLPKANKSTSPIQSRTALKAANSPKRTSSRVSFKEGQKLRDGRSKRTNIFENKASLSRLIKQYKSGGGVTKKKFGNKTKRSKSTLSVAISRASIKYGKKFKTKSKSKLKHSKSKHKRKTSLSQTKMDTI